MTESDGRGRGILTSEDREFLRGEREHISQGAKYNTRRRIRERTKDALLDFDLLFRELGEGEREKILNELSRELSEDLPEDPPEDQSGGSADHVTGKIEILGGPPPLTRALSFLFLLHEDTHQFEGSLIRALSAASRKRKETLYQKVSVDIDLTEWTRRDIQAMKQKVEEGNTDALTREEQDFLIDRLDTDTLSAVFDGQINPPSTHPEDRDEFKWP
jgi:hypothetical protein